MKSRPFTQLGAVIFLIVALCHLYRLFTHFQVTIGTHSIPMWVSYVGVILPGFLAIMLFKEARS